MVPFIFLLFCICNEGGASEDKVWQPPSIRMFGIQLPNGAVDKSVRHHPYINGTKLTLVCMGDGKPLPHFVWHKDNMYLDIDATKILDRGNLTITSLGDFDEGVYQCLARSRHGTAGSDLIHLKKVKFVGLAAPDSSERTMYQGDGVELPCVFAPSYPAPTYSWQMMNGTSVDLSLKGRYMIGSTGSLFISNVQPGDGIFYKCVVTNPMLGKSTVAMLFNLTVTSVEELPPSPPVPWILDPENEVLIAVVGHKLVLQCLFKANPTPVMSWLLPSGVSTSRYKLSQSNTTLTIQTVQEGDEGDYLCTGRNSHDQAFHKVSVKIEYSPLLKHQPKDLTVVEGDDVMFQCQAEGIPTVMKDDITWMINMRPISSYRQGDYSLSADHQRLTVSNVCKINCGSHKPPGGDLMVVQCNASNVHGYAYASAYLNVIGQTTVFVSPKEVTVDFGQADTPESVSFMCRAKHDPLTSGRESINWWTQRHQLIETERLRIKETNSSYSTLLVQLAGSSEDDWKHVRGNYTCRASNGFTGKSSSEAMRTVRLEILHPTSGGTGVIIGIVFSVVVFVLILIAGFCCLLKRRRTHMNRHKTINSSELEHLSIPESPQNITDGGNVSPWMKKVSYYHIREELQRKCLKQLQKEGHVNLKGIGGSGKTQLARYLVEHMHKETGYQAYQLDASSQEQFKKSAQRLINKLTLAEFRSTDEEVIEEAMCTLIQHSVKKGCLLVIDNITARTFPLVSVLAKADFFQLITTTNEDCFEENITVTVEGFTPEEAMSFYKKDNQTKAKDNDIEHLCRVLSCMPLPLAIAKARLKKSPMTINDYVTDCIMPRPARIAIEQHHAFRENEYNKDQITAVWEVVKQTMSNMTPKCRKVFRILSYMHENSICINNLVGMLSDENDEEGLTTNDMDAVIKAIQYSCLGNINEVNGKLFLDIHSIVNVAIRHREDEEDEKNMFENVLVFLTHVSDMDARSDDRVSWIPHLKAALHYCNFYHSNFAKMETPIMKLARIKLHLALGHRYLDIGKKKKVPTATLR